MRTVYLASVFSPGQTAGCVIMAVVLALCIAFNVLLFVMYNRRGERKLYDRLLQRQKELLLQQLANMRSGGTLEKEKTAEIFESVRKSREEDEKRYLAQKAMKMAQEMGESVPEGISEIAYTAPVSEEVTPIENEAAVAASPAEESADSARELQQDSLAPAENTENAAEIAMPEPEAVEGEIEKEPEETPAPAAESASEVAPVPTQTAEEAPVSAAEPVSEAAPVVPVEEDVPSAIEGATTVKRRKTQPSKPSAKKESTPAEGNKKPAAKAPAKSKSTMAEAKTPTKKPASKPAAAKASPATPKKATAQKSAAASGKQTGNAPVVKVVDKKPTATAAKPAAGKAKQTAKKSAPSEGKG